MFLANFIFVVLHLKVHPAVHVYRLRENKEAVSRRCSVKKVFLEISENSLSFLIKLRAWHRCFLVNFAKFLRTSFLTEQLRWLLLKKYI